MYYGGTYILFYIILKLSPYLIFVKKKKKNNLEQKLTTMVFFLISEISITSMF